MLPARRPWFWIFAVSMALAMTAAAIRLPPLYDETYYWVWSHHLSWTFLDHPPGVAGALALFRALLGEGKEALRALSLAGVVATAVFAWAASTRLTGRREAGPMALSMLFGSLMFTVGYLPATPDPLQGAVLAAAAWAVVRALEPERKPVFEVAAAGLLTLSVVVKQSSALVAVGALVGALSCGPARRRVLTGASLGGLVVGLALVVPWLVADLGSPDGATAFQGRRVLSGEGLRPFVGPALVVGVLAGTLGPTTGFALAAAPFARPSPAVPVLGGGAVALLAGVTVVSVLGVGEANWLMPALAFGLPGAVVFVRARPRFRRIHAVSCGLFAVAGFVLLAHIVHPFLPVPAAKDRTLRSAGYDVVADRVRAAARPEETKVVVAKRYQTASQLAFFLGPAFAVHELGTGRRSQFDLWPRPPLCAGDRTVVVSRSPRGFDGFRPVRGAPERVHRGRAGRTVETLFVTPAVVTKPRASCPSEGRVEPPR